MLGSKWWHHRSRHCLDVRPGMWAARWPQFLNPFCTSIVSIWSSSCPHWPLIRPGFNTWGPYRVPRVSPHPPASRTICNHRCMCMHGVCAAVESVAFAPSSTSAGIAHAYAIRRVWRSPSSCTRHFHRWPRAGAHPPPVPCTLSDSMPTPVTSRYTQCSTPKRHRRPLVSMSDGQVGTHHRLGSALPFEEPKLLL